MERGRAITQLGLIFHDPPWKPWVIRGWRNSGSGEKALTLEDIISELSKRRGTLAGRVAEDAKRLLDILCREKRSKHELHGLYTLALLVKAAKSDGNERSHGVAWEALKETCEGREIVKKADQVSAGLDRLLLMKAQQVVEEPGKGSREPIFGGRPVLKNPFEPRLELHLTTNLRLVRETIVEFLVRYVERVINLWSYCKEKEVGEEECYSMMIHGAFASLEPTWYEAAGAHGMAPPADTRIPDHTLFDHLNAALGVSNVLGEGCVARVELAAVQTWISSSRRFRDLWASSFLISALAYTTVRDVIWEHGPGTSLQPPVRGNPFYYATLAAKAGKVGATRAYDTVRELARLAIGMELERALQYPATPEGYTLLLPPQACRQLDSIVRNSLKKAWETVLKDSLNAYGPPLLQEATELPPPLPLRVWQVDVGELEKEALTLLNRINRELNKVQKTVSPENNETIQLDETDLPILKLVLAIPKLMDKKRQMSGVKLSFLSSAEVLEYMEKAGLMLRGGGPPGSQGQSTPTSGELTGSQVLCVSCGRLPAIYRDDGSRRLRRLLRGDRLCPYCAAKRALAENNVLTRVIATVTGLEIGGGRAAVKQIGSVDSYTTIAGLTLTHVVEKISKTLSESAGTRPLIADFIEQVGRVHAGVEPEAVLSDNDLTRVRMICNATVRNVGELCLKLYTHVLEASVDGSYREELLTLAQERGDDLTRLLRELVKTSTGGPEAENWKARVGEIHGLYAMVKGDGDFMGKGILRGRFHPQLHDSPRAYALSLVNLEDTSRGRRASGLFALLYEALVKSFEEAVKTGREGGELVTVRVPGPSYYYTVSRALQAIAWREIALADMLGGTVVYSGGDDVLAIIKPRSLESPEGPQVRYGLLEFLDASRRLYWGELGDAPTGFNIAGEEGRIIVPAIRGHGKSYGVVLAKAKEDLRRVIEAARVFEEAKDELKWKEACSARTCREKDIAVIGVLHGTLSVGEAAKLPLTPRNGTIQPLNATLSVLGDMGRLYSRSLPSDYLAAHAQPAGGIHAEPGLRGVIEAAVETGNKTAVRRLIEMLGRRNAYKEVDRESAAWRLAESLDSLVELKVFHGECSGEYSAHYSVLGEAMKAVRMLMRS